ncbi:hypothetical protein BEWA_009020 [Theileria equi strain WA]|uniref:Uncharacterized protein n=1 Tax=Theileria equi strain WA TaxID=1537102 RepID=L0B0Z7_THEEQ|nr:hypothetical protein BEWA_009020 [Theileria equi strain WA]AFZ81490.1 hypothetical protein BEWA_009020 [Theileria equi strain WA]|eukprot:XP_004831156.1 hypothetical protein BEWA_009020 [Theileria equi strain WA]
MSYSKLLSGDFFESQNVFTVDLGQEEHYLIPENPDEIPVFMYSNDYIPGYKVYQHHITLLIQSCSYKVRRFLYNGVEQKLPTNLEGVWSVFVLVPRKDCSKLIVKVNVSRILNMHIPHCFSVFFVREADDEWAIYLWKECTCTAEDFQKILDVFNISLNPEDPEFSDGKLEKLKLEDFESKVEEVILPESPQKKSIWSRSIKRISKICS